MKSVEIPSDAHTETRHQWLRDEQTPRVCLQTPQSDFENSPYWRIAFALATVVIGIQVFSPNPDEPVEQHTPATVQTGHVRPMV